jgi:hypothetical protein
MNRKSQNRSPAARAAIRRLLGIAMLVLFVIANVGHSFACDPTQASVTQAAISAAPNGNLDVSPDASVDAIHCHGCAAISLPATEGSARKDPISAEISLPSQSRLAAPQRPADPPPPRS